MAGDIRIETGFLDHPKTKMVRRRLGPQGAEMVMRLWFWASEHKPDGDLSGMSDEMIEMAADWEGEPGAFVSAMIDARYLDGDEQSRFLHQWAEHQPWVCKRGERKEQARNAASARWNGRSNAHSNAHSNAVSMPAACEQQCSSSESAMPPTQPNPTQTQTQHEKAIAPSAPAKRSTQIPAGFDLTDEMRQFAREHGVDPAGEFPAFCDYHRSKGSTFKDWLAAWRTWVRNSNKFGGKGKAPPASYLAEGRDDLLAALKQSGETTQ